jgi:hypothetical protein
MTNQECIFEKPIQEHQDTKTTKSLFVVSPFGYPYDEMYANIIQPAAAAAGIEAQRADRAFQLGFVMCTKICKLMQEADYVVADLTEDNPNVFYELGLAWGFGKKVVLVRDTDAPCSRGFTEVFGRAKQAVISYKELLDVEKQSKTDKAAKISGFLDNRAIDVELRCSIEGKRAQGAYIPGKQICVCYREGLADAKFYLRAVGDAAGHVISTSPWDLRPVPIAGQPLSDLLPEKLSSSKVLVVDVTHYDNHADTSIYFALGLSHAMGRETVPITNRARCRDISPFDVRGLWQVYFDKLQDLRAELFGILTVINQQYEREQEEYPLRFIWDEVLRRPARLSVFTCARGAPQDENRVGGRTNVDKWDYRSVAELAFFLANKYKQAEMSIEAPEEKVTTGLQADSGKRVLADYISEKIRRVPNSVIIIGSPDVSDYAEVVLSRIYGVAPYRPEKCKQRSVNRQRKCWDCKISRTCVGKRGYLFYKRTSTTDHPREWSAFFRKPPGNVGECVLWYGERYECGHGQRGKNAKGETFGVLTLLKDQKGLFDPDKTNRWIILLSGFTGVATYGLARLLTSLDVKTSEGKSLQETMKKMPVGLEASGMQVLVSIQYKATAREQDHDAREPIDKGVTILDVRPLFAGCNQRSERSLAETHALGSRAGSPPRRPARRKTKRRESGH